MKYAKDLILEIEDDKGNTIGEITITDTFKKDLENMVLDSIDFDIADEELISGNRVIRIQENKDRFRR